MHVTVGDHRFSGMDARRTLAHALDLLDQFPIEVHERQADRRDRIAAATAGIEAMRADVDDLVAPLSQVWPELLAARDDRVAAGLLPATALGSVIHLAVSDGGLPKRSVDRIDVDHGGAVGDRQATRRHHGSPFQALCLWSAESIAELADQGHPITPGDAGENVTVAGIDWTDVTPGVRLRLGGVLCQVSSYAVPCAQNARWFSDGDFTRIHHDNGPWSRIYATVLEPGEIGVAENAILEPS